MLRYALIYITAFVFVCGNYYQKVPSTMNSNSKKSDIDDVKNQLSQMGALFAGNFFENNRKFRDTTEEPLRNTDGDEDLEDEDFNAEQEKYANDTKNFKVIYDEIEHQPKEEKVCENEEDENQQKEEEDQKKPKGEEDELDDIKNQIFNEQLQQFANETKKIIDIVNEIENQKEEESNDDDKNQIDDEKPKSEEKEDELEEVQNEDFNDEQKKYEDDLKRIKDILYEVENQPNEEEGDEDAVLGVPFKEEKEHKEENTDYDLDDIKNKIFEEKQKQYENDTKNYQNLLNEIESQKPEEKNYEYETPRNGDIEECTEEDLDNAQNQNFVTAQEKYENDTKKFKDAFYQIEHPKEENEEEASTRRNTAPSGDFLRIHFYKHNPKSKNNSKKKYVAVHLEPRKQEKRKEYTIPKKINYIALLSNNDKFLHVPAVKFVVTPGGKRDHYSPFFTSRYKRSLGQFRFEPSYIFRVLDNQRFDCQYFTHVPILFVNTVPESKRVFRRSSAHVLGNKYLRGVNLLIQRVNTFLKFGGFKEAPKSVGGVLVKKRSTSCKKKKQFLKRKKDVLASDTSEKIEAKNEEALNAIKTIVDNIVNSEVNTESDLNNEFLSSEITPISNTEEVKSEVLSPPEITPNEESKTDKNPEVRKEEAINKIKTIVDNILKTGAKHNDILPSNGLTSVESEVSTEEVTNLNPVEAASSNKGLLDKFNKTQDTENNGNTTSQGVNKKVNGYLLDLFTNVDKLKKVVNATTPKAEENSTNSNLTTTVTTSTKSTTSSSSTTTESTTSTTTGTTPKTSTSAGFLFNFFTRAVTEAQNKTSTANLSTSTSTETVSLSTTTLEVNKSTASSTTLPTTTTSSASPTTLPTAESSSASSLLPCRLDAETRVSKGTSGSGTTIKRDVTSPCSRSEEDKFTTGVNLAGIGPSPASPTPHPVEMMPQRTMFSRSTLEVTPPVNAFSDSLEERGSTPAEGYPQDTQRLAAFGPSGQQVVPLPNEANGEVPVSPNAPPQGNPVSANVPEPYGVPPPQETVSEVLGFANAPPQGKPVIANVPEPTAEAPVFANAPPQGNPVFANVPQPYGVPPVNPEAEASVFANAPPQGNPVFANEPAPYGVSPPINPEQAISEERAQQSPYSVPPPINPEVASEGLPFANLPEPSTSLETGLLEPKIFPKEDGTENSQDYEAANDVASILDLLVSDLNSTTSNEFEENTGTSTERFTLANVKRAFLDKISKIQEGLKLIASVENVLKDTKVRKRAKKEVLYTYHRPRRKCRHKANEKNEKKPTKMDEVAGLGMILHWMRGNSTEKTEKEKCNDRRKKEAQYGYHRPRRKRKTKKKSAKLKEVEGLAKLFDWKSASAPKENEDCDKMKKR